MSESVKAALFKVLAGLLLTVIPGSVVMYATDQVSAEKFRNLEAADKKFEKKFDEFGKEIRDFKREVYKSKAFD